MPHALVVVPLKKRSEFLAVAAHRKKWVAPSFILQIAPRPDSSGASEPTLCRVGLTASKKMIGIAVDRNRARRRLRALAHEVLAAHAVCGYDFVFIARRDVLHQNYQSLRQDLEKALRRFALWHEAA